MCDRPWRTHTGERAPFWCTLLIFNRVDGQCFISSVMMHHRTHYIQDQYYNIPSDWVVHNSPSGHMDCDEWIKAMDHFSSVCCSSPLIPNVLSYDFHDRHFDDGALNILHIHHIQSLILKASDSVHVTKSCRYHLLRWTCFRGNKHLLVYYNFLKEWLNIYWSITL